jgi:hypothetical protein
MRRTTFTIPDDLLRRAKKAAADRDISMGELIRQALEDAVEPLPRVLASDGVIESGRKGIAKRAGETKFEPRSWR